MELRGGLSVDGSRLATFCRAHGIRRMAAFGSVLRNDFSPESDVDILVEFEPAATPGLLRLAEMELELAELFGGRGVELRTYEDLSPYFRDRVRSTATTIYDAA